jgi:hypothetical protein
VSIESGLRISILKGNVIEIYSRSSLNCIFKTATVQDEHQIDEGRWSIYPILVL